MKCQSCGKKEAVVRYLENINGKKQELHFCMDCAKKLGFVNFSNIFSPLFSNITSGFDSLDERDEVTCKKCGYTFDKYLSTGLFGCPECYETFSDNLDNVLIKLQGKNRHIKEEKVNKKKVNKESSHNVKKQNDVENVESLKLKLKKLVDDEKYEEAAVIRDKIRSMEGK